MKTTSEIIMWLFQLMGAAVLACWIAYASTIVQKIKKFLWLEFQPQQIKWKTWFKPIGFFIDELRELLNCPYCLSWWIGFLTMAFSQDFSLWQSTLYACLCIVFVEIYRKLTL